jgi:hypothetical protein
MKTLDEQFTIWLNNREPNVAYMNPAEIRTRRIAFIAGAAAEREAAIKIIDEIQAKNPHFAIEVKRRIREHGKGAD